MKTAGETPNPSDSADLDDVSHGVVESATCPNWRQAEHPGEF